MEVLKMEKMSEKEAEKWLKTAQEKAQKKELLTVAEKTVLALIQAGKTVKAEEIEAYIFMMD